MRKMIMAAIAAATLVATGAAVPATAAGVGQGEGAGQYRDRDRDGIPNRWDRHDNRRGESWRQHVRRCQHRYRSYNPRTDKYYAGRRYGWVRCRL
jgi:Ni/Co efflux regulator RcnB